MDAQSKAERIQNRFSPGCGAPSSVQQSHAFPVWKTTVCVRFPHRVFLPGGLWKTARGKIPDWRKANPKAGVNCKNKRKTFDFLFYKRQNAHILAHKFPECGGIHYGLYRAFLHRMWKTMWKRWKTPLETALLFHKNGGKPGGKSEKFIPERIVHTIFGCRFGT